MHRFRGSSAVDGRSAGGNDTDGGSRVDAVVPARGPSNSAILAAMTSAAGSSNAAVRSTTTNTKSEHSNISGGVLGCVKQRILRDMIDAVPGQYKLLVCDHTAATLLSACLRMHELMDHGVVLVEDLMLPRQPVINSPALYFVAPDAASVQRICEDWATRNMYKEAHIFITSTLPDELLRVLATAQPRLLEHVVTLRDMRIDFAAPERLFFHLDMRAVTLSSFFPAAIALAGGRANVLGTVTSRLVSAMFTLGSCNKGSGGSLPVIRYQASSRLAQHVARSVFDELARVAHDTPTGAASQSALSSKPDNNYNATTSLGAQRPLLIIVDRSFDALEPLLHERTYQCLLDDLMPLSNNNMYEQKYVGRSGEQITRVCPIDEEDAYWCAYRHRFFAVCLEEFARLLRELLARNPALAQGMQRSGGSDNNGASVARLQDLGNAVRALPEFQAKEAKLSMHTDICAKIMDRYKQQRLAEVCEVEQDIAAERRPFRENLEHVRKLASDAAVPSNVRLRLLLLLYAASNTREFSDGKRQQLLQSSGLATEAQRRCVNLELVVSRTGLLRQKDSPSTNPLNMAVGGKHTGDGSGSSAGSSTTSLPDRHTARGASPTTTTTTLSSSSDVSSSKAAVPDPFRSQAYLVLESAVHGTLSASDYPYLSGSAGDVLATVAAAANRDVDGTRPEPSPAAATTRRTLRMGLARLQSVTTTSSTPGANIATLDLGHEGQVLLQSTQRIILFILGGATYGEARAAYEVSMRYKHECIVGATAPLRSEDYVTQLAALQ